MVCAHCLLMGGHIEHPRVSLHSAVMDKKLTLQSAIDALRGKVRFVRACRQYRGPSKALP